MNKIKIGILTYHSVYNFGANLQVFSLVNILKNKGYIPIILNYIPLDLEKSFHSIPPAQKKAHDFFISKLPLSNICRNEFDLIETCISEKIDAIILGSDSVLIAKKKGKTSDQRYPNPFWLNWIKSDQLGSIKAVMLSTSCMGSIYPRLSIKKQLEMASSLKNFRCISVRDYWTRYMLKIISLGRVNPIMNYDPVCVLNNVLKEQQSREKPFIPHDNFILFSGHKKYISEEWFNKFKKIVNQNNYLLFELPMPEGYTGFEVDFKIPFPIDPLDWYIWIKSSKGYFGERFHSLVSCLYNKIPFFIVDTYSHRLFELIRFEYPSKVYDLCLQANQTKNRINWFNLHKCPPEYVFKNIISFDYNKSEEFIECSKIDFQNNLDILLYNLK